MNNFNREQLKEEFIKYFGEQKWKEEEFLGNLRIIEMALSNYLEVEPIPVVVEDFEEDSRYYVKENYIAISSKLITNEVETLKCLCHEYKHYHQLICITHNDTRMPMLEEWKKEFQLTEEELTNTPILYIEIDAFAFTKFIIDKWFGITIYHPDAIFDELLNKYIQKYYQ